MYDQVDITVVVPVKFNKVIAAAERTYGLIDAIGVSQFAVAMKPTDQRFGLAVYFHAFARKRPEAIFLIPYPCAGRYIGENMAVESVEVDFANIAEF